MFKPFSLKAPTFNFAFFFFSYYGYIGVVSPYASLFFAEKGMTAAQVGVLMSLTPVMRIFGPNLWGWVADRTQKRTVILQFTSFATVAAFTSMLLGQTFLHFFWIMVAVNAFASAQAPLAEAVVLGELRGNMGNYGKLRLWGSVGFIVAVTIAGQILDWQGVIMMPWIALALLALACAASFRMRESAYAYERLDAPSFASVLKRREVIAFFTSAFLMLAAHAALYVFYSLYLADKGYSKTVIGLMWTLGVIAEIVFFLYQAPVFRRFGVKNLMLACFFLAFVRFLIIGFGAESLLLLIFAQILHAATFGVHHSASIATLQQWFSGPLQARGQALFVSVSYGLGGSIGGLGFSLVWDKFGAQMVYLLAAIFGLAGAMAAALCYRWQPFHQEQA